MSFFKNEFIKLQTMDITCPELSSIDVTFDYGSRDNRDSAEMPLSGLCTEFTHLGGTVVQVSLQLLIY